jgi:hypothetical protein
MEKHILTQEDLDLHPELAERGYKVGDTIDWAKEDDIDAPETNSTQDDGGDTKDGGSHDPIGGGDPIRP